MKKITGVALLCGMAFANIPSALAADATVTFEGSIIQQTCQVANSDIAVPLGNFGVNQFPAVGTTTLPVPFSIDLTDCPDTGIPNSALVTFTGAADTDGDLMLTGGGATGVSVKIQKAGGTDINVNTQDAGIALTSDATQQLDFSASYISTATPVTAGAANAVAQVNISYP
ncbi:MAG: fimbrial protein [Citrobacter telavivensis]